MFCCLKKKKIHDIKHFFLSISMVVYYRMCSEEKEEKNKLAKDAKGPRLAPISPMPSGETDQA